MPKTQLEFIVEVMATFQGIVVILAAIAVFVATVFVLIRGRGPNVGATLLALLPIPFLLSLMGLLKGLVSGFSVLAETGAELKFSEVAEGLAEELLFQFMVLLLTAPSYLIVVVALVVRSLKNPSPTAS